MAELERGDKAVSVEELALLPIILTEACGHGITLKDLIAPDDYVILSGGVVTKGQTLLEILAAQPMGAFRLNGTTTITSEVGGVVVLRATARGVAIGLAEERAAKRLGATPEQVAYAARDLWGHSLGAERDRLVSERADAGSDPDRLRALRGRVTRQLVDELGGEIQRRSGGAGERKETP